MFMYKLKEKAFTIVELLVVIVVIGIIAGIVIVSYSSVTQKSIATSLEADLVGARGQLELYKLNNGSYPESNNCPTPAINQICLNSSGDNVLTYSSTSPFYDYLILAQNGSIQYKITNDDSAPVLVDYESISSIGDISGTIANGETLTAGAINPTGATVVYQWQRSDVAGLTYANISGATSSSYTLTSADIGRKIRVGATGTGDYGDTVYSSPTIAVVDSVNIAYDFEAGASALDNWSYSGTWSPTVVTSTTDPVASALSGTYSLKVKAYYSQTVGCTEHNTYDTIVYKDFDLDSGNYTFSFIARNSLGSTAYDKTKINIINVSDSTTLKEWSTAGCGNGTLVTGTGISFGALTSYSYTFDLASFKTIRFYIRAHNGGWQSHLLIDDISLVKN